MKSAIDADAASYNAVMKAYKAAKESPDGPTLINAALREAASVPLGVAERAKEIEQIAESLRAITNPMMSSDLTTSAALAAAAIRGALANVSVNLTSMQPGQAQPANPADQAFIAQARERIAALGVAS
jgi:formiminotetrahydrofolate cyclodeaminase